MKTGSILILGALLSAATLPAAAQDTDRSQRGVGSRPEISQDANRSHRERGMSVSREFAPSRPVSEQDLERRGPQRSLIERADTDDDGAVSRDEFVDHQTARTESNFDHRDRNRDGSLDREEAGERERPGLDIDIAELRECIASYGEDPNEEIDRFDVADTDGDGLLSLVEFATYLQERAYILFDRIDTNDDGYLSEEEVQADHDRRENYRRIVKACMEEVRSPEL